VRDESEMCVCVCVCVCVCAMVKCPATLQGRLQLAEQKLARERLDCEQDKAHAEQRILSHVAHTRVRSCIFIITRAPANAISFSSAT